MMPKQLINVIGIVVAVGILLLGIVLGVVPQLTTAASTNAEADQVATTNAAYQARIDQLERQKQNLPQIKATVAQLHRQIPAEYRLDDVFLLVARAADSANATISSVTAQDPVAFAPQPAPMPKGQPTPAPGSTPSPTATSSGNPVGQAQDVAGKADAQAAQTNAASGALGSSTATGAAAGQSRMQVPIDIEVTVPDAKAASAFLDGLRSGPRLLANVTSTATPTAGSIDLKVSALAFAAPSTAAGGNR